MVSWQCLQETLANSDDRVHAAVNNLPPSLPSNTPSFTHNKCRHDSIIVSVSHASAYTVVRATQQVNGKWQFSGVRTLQPLHWLTKNLTGDYVDELTSYAKFHKIRRDGGLLAIWWNVHLAYFFKYFSQEISRTPLQKKNTQQFQALNGLTCSTVSNLGS